MSENKPFAYRSLFWPVVLIGVGILWMLANLNVLPNNTFASVFRLWPLLLIACGLDVMIGRRSPVVGGVIGLLFVGGLLGLVMAGPALGLAQTNAVKEETFQEPVNGAEKATIQLDTHQYPVDIHALSGSTNLVDATLQHRGTVIWTTSGTTERRVGLAYREVSDFMSFDFNPEARWRIGLSPQVPLELLVDSGSGSVNMDLKGLMLNNLSLNSGSGSVNLHLPQGSQAYSVSIDSGSGSVEVDLPAGTSLTVMVNSGSGSVNITLPAASELRVELRNGGSGSFNFPNRALRTSGNSDEDEGVWQTAGYETAKYQVEIIIVDQGSGSVNIH
jgi:hypothetical protein